MRISDWSSDVCSSDLTQPSAVQGAAPPQRSGWRGPQPQARTRAAARALDWGSRAQWQSTQGPQENALPRSQGVRRNDQSFLGRHQILLYLPSSLSPSLALFSSGYLGSSSSSPWFLRSAYFRTSFFSVLVF